MLFQATVIATLVSSALSVGTVYVQHKVGERNKQRRIANALLAEINATFDTQYQDLNEGKEIMIQKAADGTERFTAWGGDTHTFYKNSINDLLLLDSETITSIIRFYDRASFKSKTVHNMASDSFHALPREKKSIYVDRLYKDLEQGKVFKDSAVILLTQSTIKKAYWLA